jgi:hypothetical protein
MQGGQDETFLRFSPRGRARHGSAREAAKFAVSGMLTSRQRLQMDGNGYGFVVTTNANWRFRSRLRFRRVPLCHGRSSFGMVGLLESNAAPICCVARIFSKTIR